MGQFRSSHTIYPKDFPGFWVALCGYLSGSKIFSSLYVGQKSSNNWHFAVQIFREDFGRTYVVLAEMCFC